jgi:hypothetical protein
LRQVLMTFRRVPRNCRCQRNSCNKEGDLKHFFCQVWYLLAKLVSGLVFRPDLPPSLQKIESIGGSLLGAVVAQID